jgi:hypothetical protein
MKRSLSHLVIVLVLLGSCKKDHDEKCAFIPDTKKITVDLQIQNLEDSLPSVKTKRELVNFLTRHPELRDHFFGRANYPDDSVFINTLFKRFTNLGMDTLLTETHKVFGDYSLLRDQFKQAFANIKYYYPNFRIPKIQTMVSGLEDMDLLVTDTLIVVGLDFYLGPGAKYRPRMYDYILRRYNKDFIVPSALLLYGINPSFNKTKLTDRTALADMIAYGKAYYFAKHMLPCAEDSVLMGYTREEMSGAKENEDLIYIRLIENEVIYSTSHQVKQRYLDERPQTLEVGEKCPGRIGTWVGWRIVDAYANRHSDKSLPQIMETKEPEKIFKESKYRPERP